LIAYGGDHTVVAAKIFTIPTKNYYLSIARIEPENNCHLILAACNAVNIPLVFIGNWAASNYGKNLKACYSGSQSLTLLDPVYDLGELAAFRASAVGYIHGHSVGGTNPSLVEALFHTKKILAFDCVFNRATLADNGSYFGSMDGLIGLLRCDGAGLIDAAMLTKLREQYRWAQIVDAYLEVCR
jgi:glycosyltransferase involved in cell wall biosynthesis